MKIICVFLSVFVCFFAEVRAQETSYKRFSYGLEGQLITYPKNPFGFFSRRRFVTYSVGGVVKYMFSDTSRIKLDFGLFYTPKKIEDTRGWICDPISCPWITLSYHYLEFPVLLQYVFFKNKKIQPFANFGFVPALLIFGTEKTYSKSKNKDGEIDKVKNIEHYSIFKGYNESFTPPMDFGLVFGIGIDIKINKIYINVGAKAHLGMARILKSYRRYHALTIGLSAFY